MKASTTVYIRPGRDDNTPLEWCQRNGAAEPAIRRGSWEQLRATLQPGVRIVVLAPASGMVTLRASLPRLNRKRLAQALPYALEDAVADNVEMMHFACGEREADGELPVVAVALDEMKRWQEWFRQADIQPHALLNEALCLPWREGQWSLLLDDNGATLRFSSCEGVALTHRQLPAVLELIGEKQKENRPETLRLYDARNGAATAETVSMLEERLGIDVQHEVIEAPLELLSRCRWAESINLLQGEFSHRQRIEKLWRPWRLSAGLLLAIGLIQLGMFSQQYWELKARDAALYAQIEKTFRETFPEVRNVVNPRVQMERKLQALRGSGDDDLFLRLMAKGAPVLAAEDALKVDALRFKQQALQVELDMDSLQVLDRVKQRLVDSGLAVEVLSASATGDGVRGHIEIREDGA